jgi:hypothetical protein
MRVGRDDRAPAPERAPAPYAAPGERTVMTPRFEPEPAPAPRVPEPYAAAPPPRPAAEDGATRYVSVPTIARGRVAGVLVAVEGELEGQIFAIRDGENRLGRAAGCEVRLDSEWISREHALLMHTGGVFAIKPLTPKNPTFLNDEQTEGAEVKDGDLIRLGRTSFRFRSVV